VHSARASLPLLPRAASRIDNLRSGRLSQPDLLAFKADLVGLGVLCGVAPATIWMIAHDISAAVATRNSEPLANTADPSSKTKTVLSFSQSCNFERLIFSANLRA